MDEPILDEKQAEPSDGVTRPDGIAIDPWSELDAPEADNLSSRNEYLARYDERLAACNTRRAKIEGSFISERAKIGARVEELDAAHSAAYEKMRDSAVLPNGEADKRIQNRDFSDDEARRVLAGFVECHGSMAENLRILRFNNLSELLKENETDRSKSTKYERVASTRARFSISVISSTGIEKLELSGRELVKLMPRHTRYSGGRYTRTIANVLDYVNERNFGFVEQTTRGSSQTLAVCSGHSRFGVSMFTNALRHELQAAADPEFSAALTKRNNLFQLLAEARTTLRSADSDGRSTMTEYGALATDARYCETVIDYIDRGARPIITERKRLGVAAGREQYYTMRYGFLGDEDSRDEDVGVILRYDGLVTEGVEEPVHRFSYIRSTSQSKPFVHATVDDPGSVLRDVENGMLDLEEGMVCTDLGYPVHGLAARIAARIIYDVKRGVECTPRRGEIAERVEKAATQYDRRDEKQDPSEQLNRSDYHQALYQLSGGCRLPGTVFGSGDQTYAYLIGGYVFEESLDPNVATRFFRADRYLELAASGKSPDQLHDEHPEGYVDRRRHDTGGKFRRDSGWHAEMVARADEATTCLDSMSGEQLRGVEYLRGLAQQIADDDAGRT